MDQYSSICLYSYDVKGTLCDPLSLSNNVRPFVPFAHFFPDLLRVCVAAYFLLPSPTCFVWSFVRLRVWLHVRLSLND